METLLSFHMLKCLNVWFQVEVSVLEGCRNFERWALLLAVNYWGWALRFDRPALNALFTSCFQAADAMWRASLLLLPPCLPHHKGKYALQLWARVSPSVFILPLVRHLAKATRKVTNKGMLCCTNITHILVS